MEVQCDATCGALLGGTLPHRRVSGELAAEHPPATSGEAVCRKADRRQLTCFDIRNYVVGGPCDLMTLSNTSNHFISNLPELDRQVLQPHLRTVELEHGKILHRAGDVVERMYFPHDGVISFIVGMSDGRFVEAGMFGRNSVVSPAAALDGPIALNQAVVQAKGRGSVIDTSVMRRLAREHEAIRVALASHEQMMSAHSQQVAACNALHELEARLCR